MNTKKKNARRALRRPFERIRSFFSNPPRRCWRPLTQSGLILCPSASRKTETGITISAPTAPSPPERSARTGSTRAPVSASAYPARMIPPFSPGSRIAGSSASPRRSAACASASVTAPGCACKIPRSRLHPMHPSAPDTALPPGGTAAAAPLRAEAIVCFAGE